MNIRKTISLPKPLHEFAIEESKKLMYEAKGVKKENVSMLVTELIRERRDQRLKKAA